MKYSPIEYKWFGELALHLRGNGLSSCLTELQQRGVPLKHVRVRGRTGSCGVCLKDFDTVYQICRSHHVRFRIVERRGLPFWKKRIWRRKTFALGLVLFVCMVSVMSQMVWRIDVVGTKDEDGAAEIRDAASSVGLFTGQLKHKMQNPITLQQSILAKTPDFVWVGVRVQGTVVRIQAIPKVEGTKPLNETPHDIIATKPAVIRRVAATRGKVVVKPNQFVQPGQTLISGYLADGAQSVPATGQVLAEVWYTSKVSVPLKVMKGELTGQSVSRDYLQIGSLRLRIWGWQEPQFASTYERDTHTDWHIGKFVLPIQEDHVQLYEAKSAVEETTVEAAKQKALNLAKADVGSKIGGDGQILGQSVLHPRLEHGTLYETVLTRVEENIGKPAPIPAPQKSAEDSDTE